MNKPRLWTKDFLVVSSINFLITLIFYSLMVTIAVYAVDEFNASDEPSRTCYGYFYYRDIIWTVIYRTIYRFDWSQENLVYWFTLFYVNAILYFVNFGLTFLLINRLIHGIAIGVASTATGTIVAQTIPATRRGEGIGYYSMSATLATAIGPFIGLFMSQHTSYQMIFIFCLGLGVISLLIAFFLHIPVVEIPLKLLKRKDLNYPTILSPEHCRLPLLR